MRVSNPPGVFQAMRLIEDRLAVLPHNHGRFSSVLIIPKIFKRKNPRIDFGGRARGGEGGAVRSATGDGWFLDRIFSRNVADRFQCLASAYLDDFASIRVSTVNLARQVVDDPEQVVGLGSDCVDVWTMTWALFDYKIGIFRSVSTLSFLVVTNKVHQHQLFVVRCIIDPRDHDDSHDAEDDDDDDDF